MIRFFDLFISVVGLIIFCQIYCCLYSHCNNFIGGAFFVQERLESMGSHSIDYI
jgi:lipopolysaccharide/colanic/teichoic acid biosynthesis glycosyltransferase